MKTYEDRLDEALDKYELRADEGDHITTDFEKFLIKDFVMGWESEELKAREASIQELTERLDGNREFLERMDSRLKAYMDKYYVDKDSPLMDILGMIEAQLELSK